MAFAYVDSTKADGLVAPEYAQAIIAALPEHSAALTLMSSINMGTKQMVVPVNTVLPVAAGVAQGAAISVSNPEWAGRNMYAGKFAFIVPIAREIFYDSSFDFETQVMPLAIRAIGGGLDAAIFRGISVPTEWSANSIVSGATAAGSKVTFSSTGNIINAVNDLMGLVESDGYNVNGFVGWNSLKQKLRNARSTDGIPLYTPVVGGVPAELYGCPIIFSTNSGLASGAQLICGDFSKGLVGIREDINVTVLKEASLTTASDTISLAQNDMIGLKFVFRAGFQVANHATGVTGAYPFSVLVGS